MNLKRVKYFLILLSIFLFLSCEAEQNVAYIFSAKLDTAYSGLDSEELNSLLEDGKILISVLPIDNKEVIELDLKDYYTVKDNNIIVQFEAEVPITDKQILSVLLAKKNKKKKSGYDLYYGWAGYFNDANVEFKFETLFNLNGKIRYNADSLKGAELIAYSSIKSPRTKRLFSKKHTLDDDSFEFNFMATSFFNNSLLEKLPEDINIDDEHFNSFITVKKDDKIGFALPSKVKNRRDIIKNNRKLLGDEAVCFAKDLICKATEKCDNVCVKVRKCFNSPEVEVGKSVMAFYENDNKSCVSSQIGDITPNKDINLDIFMYKISNIIDKIDLLKLDESVLVTSVFVNNSTENLNADKNGDIKSRMGIDFLNKTIVLGTFYISGFNLHDLFIDQKNLDGSIKSICNTQPRACNSELYKTLKDKELKAKIKIEYENYYIEYDGLLSLYTVSSILGQSTFKDNINGWVLQNRYPFYAIYNADGTPYENTDEVINLNEKIKKVTIITDSTEKVINF